MESENKKPSRILPTLILVATIALVWWLVRGAMSIAAVWYAGLTLAHLTFALGGLVLGWGLRSLFDK